jgi:replicative DNA helicase
VDAAGVLAYTARLAEMLDAADAREETGEIGPIADEVEALAEGDVIGWQTGIGSYDAWAGGMRGGEVHIVGGASGVGKTWLLAQIANAGADADKRVAFVSLEMSAREIYARLIAGRIGLIAYRLLGRGRTWSAEEHAAYREARAVWEAHGRIYTALRSVEQIEAMVRRTTPDVLCVDYLQLVDWPKDSGTEYAALTQVANRLQRLAKRSGAVLVLATQMARASIRGGDDGVQGGMGSGRIDQIADLWTLIRRSEDGVELACRKNRHGVTGGVARVELDARRGRFVE